ncbi:MAG: hypothetical protein QXY80_06930 [Candidatus Jordarchaeales archaeon]
MVEASFKGPRNYKEKVNMVKVYVVAFLVHKNSGEGSETPLLYDEARRTGDDQLIIFLNCR